ncbi:LysM peptidoglycan-binding domain-containing protein [Paenibacillus sp. N4]|nr:LysM peptidoglycan-binding domain-containing protein [Paenibacillus vietnamensis]
MRIYVAGKKDTLRTIASKYGIDLGPVLSLNPRIRNPDLNIAGLHTFL